MYVQSDSKRKKEQSIDEKLSKQCEQEIDTIKNALYKKGGNQANKQSMGAHWQAQRAEQKSSC